MAIKIKKLYIKNFKVYKEQFFDFENKKLIVFDGPNGFGKSSIFDAIELLFTGQIRRYKNLSLELNDGRENKSENPFYNYDGEGDSIVIKILFEFNKIEYILARSNVKIGVPVLDFSHFDLHTLNSFEEEINFDNKVDDVFLEKFLGLNYKRDFEFINYIEQEDTLVFLKKKEKDKKKGIEYLFNTADYNDKIKKFDLINKKLKLILDNGDNGIVNQITTIEFEIKEISESFKHSDEIFYNQLFKGKAFEWDLEDVKFGNYTQKELFDPIQGLIFRLENLILHKNDFLSYTYNSQIDELIAEETSLVMFYKYFFFQAKEKQILDEYTVLTQFNNIKEKINEFNIDLVAEKVLDLSDIFTEIITDKDITALYADKLINLKKEYGNADLTSQIYAKLLETRESLILHLNDYHEKINDNGICPLCGEDWKTSVLLIEQIEKQKEQLEILTSNLDKSLNIEIENFKAFFNNNFVPVIEKEFISFIYDENYFEDDFFDLKAKKRTLVVTRLQLNALQIDFESNVSKENFVNEIDDSFRVFKDFIQSKKKDFDEENIKDYFEEDFVTFFNSKVEDLENLHYDSFDAKKKYLNWKYSLYQNELLQNKNKLLAELKIKRKKISEPQVKIEKIISSLNASLIWYNDLLIKDIEILFHIYSGRIVQDFQGGLGLFIINNKDKIKFVTSPNRTFDAVFSMSTGQLSALALSFTLALNKKYSTSNLLLIDDPIQSMDDINTAGFVEVLRNDFANRQIFFSTHETMMSTYLRYKFKKFGLDSIRLDLSNLS